MSAVIEYSAITIVRLFTGSLYPLIPGVWGTDAGNSVEALSPQAISLLIRQDNGDPDRKVNVFDGEGNTVYTIERLHGYDKYWRIYAQPNQSQVAALTIGLLYRAVDQVNPGSTLLKMGSGVLGKLHRHYHDREGHLYSWNRRALFLEQIANPNGGHEERRKRVAQATLLRPGRFDWELQIDAENVDVINTLATAFITMRTQWLTTSGYTVSAPGSRPSAASLAPVDGYPDGTADDVPSELLAYRPEIPIPEPTNFFNPPKFLEHKFTDPPNEQ